MKKPVPANPEKVIIVHRPPQNSCEKAETFGENAPVAPQAETPAAPPAQSSQPVEANKAQ